MFSFQDKVVVITGASSGIGEACALAFAQEGCSLVLAARRVEKLDMLKEKIEAVGVPCLVMKTDVSKLKDVQRLFSEVKKQFSTIDILVNNAGVGRNSSFVETSLQDWKETVDINLTGVFYCTQEAVQVMLDTQRKGHIITVSSILGLIPLPGRSAYCASKHAVTGFKRSLRFELKKYGIRISLVHPAGIDTDILKDLAVERKKWKMLRSSDLAEYIVALASRDLLRIASVRMLNIARRLYYVVKYYPH